jgi:hypothetical protein
VGCPEPPVRKGPESLRKKEGAFGRRLDGEVEVFRGPSQEEIAKGAADDVQVEASFRCGAARCGESRDEPSFPRRNSLPLSGS